MIHARRDYNRIQDPATTDPTLLPEGCTAIGQEEPVLLFRAQDRHFVDVLLCYKQMLAADDDVKQEIIDAVSAQIDLALRWQTVHGCKSPDLPEVV